MSVIVTATTILLLLIGVAFFLAGSMGLLRFPDVHARLHALTKADNLGLGFITLALLPQAADVWIASKLVMIWLLTMLAAATVSQLIARSALHEEDVKQEPGP
ncbi:MAG: monovalent cation/H(+) antiporter subunit G [Beijerinckiaceae bacterium]|nr:monovalent cation/H(+) antiporter subunit G [Beijerinckiaceae bacterium]